MRRIAILAAQMRELECSVQEEIQKDGRNEVNEEVYGMIAEDIRSAEEIIQTETEIRQRSGTVMNF